MIRDQAPNKRRNSMAGYSELHKYLMRLVILPVSVLCAVVSLTYFYLYSQEKKHTISAHQTFLTALLKPSFTLLETDRNALDTLANSILAIDAHRGIVIKDHTGNLLASYGRPDDAIVLQNPSSNFANENHFYYVIPVAKSHNDQGFQGGTIIVQTESFYSQLNSHKAITGAVLAAAFCFLVLLYFARQFDVALTGPLTRIQTGIRAFLNGEYGSSIKIHSGSIYEELVNLINSLAALHKTGQDRYQENIEQTIQDLKETLETVEIQNIEIDLERKNAVQANRAKSEFLTNTSHELKTPLNSIIGFTELLDKTALSEQQSNYLHSINDAAKGLSATINDILDFSRLEIGTLTLEHKPVNVRDLLDEAIQQLAAAATKQDIRLLTIVDHDVPDNLLGDPLRVKQVLTNLISNAIKFTPEGYVLITISNELISDERYTLRFKVTDSGIGISSGQQDTLFSSAIGQFPPSANRQRSTGSGLGLIIAKGLVERMNGHIEVESAEGEGSTFWFTATFAKNLALKNQQENRLRSLQKINALIIDRNTMSRMELNHYLRGWGIEPLENPRFDIAEELCEKHFTTNEQNIIILDIESLKQEMNNAEILKKISDLATDYDACCILIYRADENKLFALQNKPSYVMELVKPVLYQSLYQQLCTRFSIRTQRFFAEDLDVPAESQLSHVRILAVDDNPANLKLVKELLKDKGVETDTADSGSDAVSLFQNAHYDLILMDVQMPELDGMATTIRIRELEQEGERIPIIALTAHAANEKKMALLIAGMDDYLSKPVSSDDLQHILDRWVSQQPHAPSSTDTPKIKNQAHSSSEASSPVSLKLSLEKSQNKADLAKDMLQMLLASLEESKTAIQQHLKSNNIEAVQEVVHKLHGGCCYCGVPALTSICAKIDGNLQQNNTKTLTRDIGILYARIDELNLWAKDIALEELFATE